MRRPHKRVACSDTYVQGNATAGRVTGLKRLSREVGGDEGEHMRVRERTDSLQPSQRKAVGVRGLVANACRQRVPRAARRRGRSS